MKNGAAFSIGILSGGIGFIIFNSIQDKQPCINFAGNSNIPTSTKIKPLLKARYISEIKPYLNTMFRYRSVMQIPTLTKVVVNIGFSESNFTEGAIRDLTIITGQKPQIIKSHNGTPLGSKVTLRHDLMWVFTDRLISFVLPHISGLSPNQFDGRGNYTFRLADPSVFPGIEQDKNGRQRGMDITFVTTAKNDVEGYELLKQLGFSFHEK